MPSFGPYSPNNAFSSSQPSTTKVRLYHGEATNFLQNLLGEVEPDEGGNAVFTDLSIDPGLLRFCYFDYGPVGSRQFFTDYRHTYDEGDFDHISSLTFNTSSNELTGELVE